MVVQRHFGNKIPMQAVNLYYLADGRIVGERRQPDLAQEVGLLFLIRHLRANSARCGESCTPWGAVSRLLRRSREMRRRRHPWPGWLSPVVRAAWLREPLNRTRSVGHRLTAIASRARFVTNDGLRRPELTAEGKVVLDIGASVTRRTTAASSHVTSSAITSSTRSAALGSGPCLASAVRVAAPGGTG
ncbi:hypothetical protein OG252_34185 [Streptomyces sp. NBC_01352]|uniref:hypothetical protein n=1 Tax=unclassified Streptomyces TaxID=2593676 RepID=UPI002E2EAE97|nr:hypothetical protein [Streptomyces sp. NBC_01352]